MGSEMCIRDRGLSALGLADIQPEDISRLDSISHIPDLQRVGAKYAQLHLDIDSHFHGFL